MTTPTQPIKFEKGKFYRTRDRSKYQLVFIIPMSNYTYSTHLFANETDYITTNSHGKFNSDFEHRKDIISEWRDEPVVDWSKMSASTCCVTKDKFGQWYEWDTYNVKYNGGWFSSTGFCIRIKPQFYPTFSGDWKDSLCRRPQ